MAALEDVVIGDGPSYTRLYAGTRLVFHWTAMRWDDSLGVHPSLLVQRARGVLRQLERTKTSGSDKQALTLPIFVSEKAYLGEPHWLNTWLALLQSEDFGFERDYLLPLANEKLDGCLRCRAKYSDAVGYSLALLCSLASPGDSGEALLIEEMGAKKSERGFLGRRAVTGSQDRYVRTATRVVENLQIQAAHAAMLLLNGGYDRFGEETALEGLRAYLLQKRRASSLKQQSARSCASRARTPRCTPRMGPALRTRAPTSRLLAGSLRLPQSRRLCPARRPSSCRP